MGIVRAPLLLNESSAQVIKGSLKFDSGSSQYLGRTPGSTGNRRTWTWAAWVKRSVFGADKFIFSAGSDASNQHYLRFQSNNTLEATEKISDSNQSSLITNAVHRDTGWYHLVYVFDSTQATSSNRVSLYVNGVKQTSFSTNTYPSQNHDSYINNTSAHYIGSSPLPSAYYDGGISQVYLIDGQALGPGYFGFTDPLTNTWRPRKFRAVGTTINDGTVWSSLASVSSGSFQGSYPATNGFNGTLTSSDRANGDTNGSSIDLDFSGKNIIVKNDIAIWSGKSSMRYSINGGEYVSYSDATEKWKTILFSGRLLSLKIKHGSDSEQPGFSGLAVDGVTMLDSTTTDLDFGTNGFYLPMENADDFEIDKSGKGNNWTKTNFTGTSINPDVLKDSPSGAVSGGRAQTGITTTSSAPANYATWSIRAEQRSGGITISEGNLHTNCSGTRTTAMSEFPLTGKTYWEVVFNSGTYNYIGMTQNDGFNTTANDNSGIKYAGYKDYSYGWGQGDGNLYNASNIISSDPGTYTNGQAMGWAYDADNNILKIYKDGVLQHTQNNIIDAQYYPAITHSNSATSDANFGQKPFKYAPPQGYLPLNSASATPETVIPRPDQYVGVATHTGTGSAQKISLTFQSDLIWTKTSSNAVDHKLVDSVRGLTKVQEPNNKRADSTVTNGVTGTTINGFTIGDSTDYNTSGRTYVSWCWRAGGNKNTFNVDNVGYSTYTDAPGLNSGTIPLTGASVGTKQGFSILKYTGSGSNGTLAHGLSQAPDFFFGRDIEDTGGSRDWIIYHKSIGNTGRLKFTTDGTSTSSTFFQDTSPTNSLITVGTSNDINSTNDYILYCWHNVPGLQKFGKYPGNNDGDSKDGPVVPLGFRPALVAIKRLGTGNWIVYDIERDKINPLDGRLYWNTSSANVDNSGYNIDFLSNGFKITGGNNDNYNAESDYVYAAWAEAPEFNLYGAPSNARC